MRRFISRFSLFIALIMVFFFVRIIASNYKNLSKDFLKFVPLNNVSNSISFKAKMDFLINSSNFRNSTFLVIGSSIALNNISGEIISYRTKDCVCNISSWNLKPEQLLHLLGIIDLDKIEYLLLPFNNCDFGKPTLSIDFNSTDLFLNGNNISRFWSFIDKFNINTFSNDWSYKCKYSDINNNYESLRFDEFGSVQLDRDGFVINENRWNESLKDTTGFNYFLKDVIEIDRICQKKRISLILVYLPSRKDLLTNQNVMQNKTVSKILQNEFGKYFLDMQNLNLPISQFSDGNHLFKLGAEKTTNSIIDSLSKRDLVNLPDQAPRLK
jgi:hypothetical protein